MFATLRDLPDREASEYLRGADVYGAEEEKLGTVDDAIVDASTGELRYLIVDAGWLSTRKFMVPADQVFGFGESDDLFVNLTRKQAKSLPPPEDRWLTSNEFPRYEREYRQAWNFDADRSRHGSSSRLERVRERLRASVSRAGTTAKGTSTGSLGVFGVYRDRGDVERAVNELKSRGFQNSDISVLFPNRGESQQFAVEHATKAPEGALAGGGTGLVVGGALGWLAAIGAITIPGIGPFIAAGPIVAAITGAGVGSAIGGIAGALIGLGVPEFEARKVERAVREGGILVAVHSDDVRYIESARGVLESTKANDVFVTGERRAA